MSSGCIRLTNDDVIDLFNRVQVGAKVIVLPQAGAPLREAKSPAPRERISFNAERAPPLLDFPQTSQLVARPCAGLFFVGAQKVPASSGISRSGAPIACITGMGSGDKPGARRVLQIGAEIAGARDQGRAESARLPLIGRQRGVDIAGRRRQRIGQPGRIQRGLADAGADMRPRDESGIAQQRHAAGDDARRFQIEDRLKERRRRRLGHGHVLRRQKRARLGAERGDHFGRISGGGMPAA